MEWDISIGFYPGILFGMRTYNNINGTSHVFYLPLIDLCIDIYNEREEPDRDEEQD